MGRISAALPSGCAQTHLYVSPAPGDRFEEEITGLMRDNIDIGVMYTAESRPLATDYLFGEEPVLVTSIRRMPLAGCLSTCGLGS